MKSPHVPERHIQYRKYQPPQRRFLSSPVKVTDRPKVLVDIPITQVETIETITLEKTDVFAFKEIPKPIVKHHSIPTSSIKPQSFDFITPPTNRPTPSLATHRSASRSIPQPVASSPVEIVSTEAHFSKIAQSVAKEPKHWKPRLLYGLATLIVVVGLGVSLQSWSINDQALDQVQALADKDEEEAVILDEKELPQNATKTYAVAADLPRVIRISSLGIEARILGLGVDKNNQMETPRSIFDAGWYNASSKPGNAGAMIINGHVSGPSKPGVFKKLHLMKAGDIVRIEKGDGSVLEYDVVSLESVSAEKVDMIKLLNSAIPDKPGMNLITCGGSFDPTTNEFESRTIVYTVQRS